MARLADAIVEHGSLTTTQLLQALGLPIVNASALSLLSLCKPEGIGLSRDGRWRSCVDDDDVYHATIGSYDTPAARQLRERLEDATPSAPFEEFTA